MKHLRRQLAVKRLQLAALILCFIAGIAWLVFLFSIILMKVR